MNVRLPDEMVQFIDQLVADGVAKNRTSAIAASVEREMRARRALRDVRILEASGTDDDLDVLVEWAGQRTIIED